MRSVARAAPLLLAALAGSALACAHSKPGDTPAPAAEDTRQICRGTSPPDGWIMIDSYWDRDRCPQAGPPGNNVLTIWRFDDKPVGTKKQVCERCPTPPGWVASSHRWDPAHCRTGQAIEATTVKTIERVH